MKVAVIGSGGREHAICLSLKKSQKIKQIYCIPGNAGTEQIAKNVKIETNDFDKLKDFVLSNNIDLIIVGPEKPLVDGIVDYLEKFGIKVFGPNKIASQLEGSKIFTKKLCEKYKIPTANFGIFKSIDESCFGAEDAEAILNILSGEGPYEIQWSTGETSDLISNLTSGIYSVEISDAHLCNSSIEFNIEDEFCTWQYDGNDDGCVNVHDILDFLLEYGKCSTDYPIEYDGNLDGCSTSEDLLNILSVYGQCE